MRCVCAAFVRSIGRLTMDGDCRLRSRRRECATRGVDDLGGGVSRGDDDDDDDDDDAGGGGDDDDEGEDGVGARGDDGGRRAGRGGVVED